MEPCTLCGSTRGGQCCPGAYYREAAERREAELLRLDALHEIRERLRGLNVRRPLLIELETEIRRAKDRAIDAGYVGD